jgi:hypothetical protein
VRMRDAWGATSSARSSPGRDAEWARTLALCSCSTGGRVGPSLTQRESVAFPSGAAVVVGKVQGGCRECWVEAKKDVRVEVEGEGQENRGRDARMCTSAGKSKPMMDEGR